MKKNILSRLEYRFKLMHQSWTVLIRALQKYSGYRNLKTGIDYPGLLEKAMPKIKNKSDWQVLEKNWYVDPTASSYKEVMQLYEGKYHPFPWQEPRVVFRFTENKRKKQIKKNVSFVTSRITTMEDNKTDGELELYDFRRAVNSFMDFIEENNISKEDLNNYVYGSTEKSMYQWLEDFEKKTQLLMSRMNNTISSIIKKIEEEQQKQQQRQVAIITETQYVRNKTTNKFEKSNSTRKIWVGLKIEDQLMNGNLRYESYVKKVNKLRKLNKLPNLTIFELENIYENRFELTYSLPSIEILLIKQRIKMDKKSYWNITKTDDIIYDINRLSILLEVFSNFNKIGHIKFNKTLIPSYVKFMDRVLDRFKETFYKRFMNRSFYKDPKPNKEIQELEDPDEIG